MSKTRNVLVQVRTLLFQTARKALASWVIGSLPAVVELVQKNYGQAVGVELAAVLSGLGVYKVENK